MQHVRILWRVQAACRSATCANFMESAGVKFRCVQGLSTQMEVVYAFCILIKT